uniref:hypothetical protein n=1 Tax=Gelidibacter sp. TaxID=2018083 RepID=UPI00404AECE5
MSDSIVNSDSKVQYVPCTKDDIIMFDIVLLLSGKTFYESQNLLFNTIEHLKKLHTFTITPEAHKETRDLMINHLID